MNVQDIMTKDVIAVSPDDLLSVAIGHMHAHGISQVAVMDGKTLHGMVELKAIVTKKIDIHRAKAGTLCKKTPVVYASMSTNEALTLLLNSGLKALPVIDNGSVVGIVAETDFMSLVSSREKVSTIMTACASVGPDVPLGDVKKIMLEHNVSRVPVVSKGSIVGVIRAFDLIRSLESNLPEGTGRSQKLRGRTEKKRAEQFSSKPFLSPAAMVSKDSPINEVAKIMKANHDVFVADAGQLYVVTPKDVLEAEFLHPSKGVDLQFANLGHEDPYIAYQIEQAVKEFSAKLKEEIPGVLALVCHLERHYHGGKVKYSLRARTYTSLGMFVAKAWGWDPLTVTQELLNKLEREALSRKGKVRDKRQRSEFVTKRRR